MESTDTDSVRVGIVGLGGIGNHHAKRIERLGHDIVSGLDIDADSRRSFAERYGCPTHDGVDAFFDEGVDAVLVTTPNRYHEKYAVEALERGVDVLLEKPLAHTLESAERIAEAAADAEGFCMVGFNNRFAPGMEVLKARQADGQFGEITHVEANYVRRRGIPGRGSWFTTEAVSGGGSLIDIGVHAIDLAMYVLDFPAVEEVAGRTRSTFGGREDYTYLQMWGPDDGPEGFDVDDSATALVRLEGDATIALDVAWASNRPGDEEVVVTGTEAGATFDRATGELTVYETERAGTPQLTDVAVETASRDTHEAEERRFFEAVRTGEPPRRNTPEQALRVQRIVDAIYRSDEAGRAVTLD